MTDPVTTGTLVAWTVGMASEAALRGVVGEAVKDAYKALKVQVSRWAASDVVELEKNPNSVPRRALISEAIDGLSQNDRESLGKLAQTLVSRLKEQASAIGLEVNQLTALEVELGNITVTHGIGVRIQDARVDGTFKAGDISVESPRGKM